MITIVTPEGSSTTEALKRAIENLGSRCEILLLSDSNLIVDKNFRLDSDIIHPRCGIGNYLDRLTMYSWQVLNSLECEGSTFINNLKTVYDSSDKFKTIKILSKNKINTPKTAIVRDYEDAKRFMERENLEYPVILKNSFSKCGITVKKITSDEELKKYTKNAIWEGTLVQEYINFSKKGIYKDIRILVVGEEVVGGYSRVSKNFITNLYLGGTIEPIKLNEELNELALKCAQSMKGDIMGIDILPSKDDCYYVIETNAVPGIKGFKYLGIDVDYKIAEFLIEYGKS
ncbi:MAG TPA: coenzyme gamma-F420-2:alpha-L-glutamate ligase [Methanothermococcus okinawensis]|uniref:Coenzyme gamma-F420-2:alpha-L-glutamate ligase n=1 Tax=Methanothermococcus okinawensis TaxID=155863 RepID=A0A832YWS3_9EURY|nr:coenzyme gamma-F420-2:alpha-L-glutamate ligase [Methanothermococcus okinawensis]